MFVTKKESTRAAAPDQPAANLDAVPTETIKLLLIEDNPGDSRLIRELLGEIDSCRYEVDWVPTLEKGVAALARADHDVALVDFNLTGGTALDILHEAADAHWAAPIIVLSSLDSQRIDRSVMKTGACDFLEKSDLSATALERSIRYAIEKKRTETALLTSNDELHRRVAELNAAKRQIELQEHSIVSLARHLASSAPPRPGVAAQDGEIGEPPAALSGRDLGLWQFTASGRTVGGNAALLKLFELSDIEDMQQRCFESLLSQDSKQRLESTLALWSGQSAETIELEFVGQRSGRRSWVVMSGLVLECGADEPIYQATVVDITERKNNEEATRFLARHDSLTGLANRRALNECLRQAMAITRRSGRHLALLCLDLNDFKAVNDIHGHKMGDLLLREVAAGLSARVRASDTVARLGGDEFVIVATNLERAQDASTLAAKIVEQLSQPFVIRGQTVGCGVSIGIALYPQDSEDPDQLIELADFALCRAKQNPSRRWQFFDTTMNSQLVARRKLEQDLRSALEDESFTLSYQPLFDLHNDELCGFEALLRWQPPDGESIPVKELVCVSEDSGLIVPIGAWVLQAACRAMVGWSGGPAGLPLVVNVSPVQLRDAGFVALVGRTLSEVGLDPARLRLDITGHAAARDLKATTRCLSQLKDMGVKLTLDGVGGEKGSLIDLQGLPIDQFKLGNRLMARSLDSECDAAFARALVELGRAHGLSIAAKGLESERHLRLARELGCDQGQGLHLRPPLAAAEVADWLRQPTRRDGRQANS